MSNSPVSSFRGSPSGLPVHKLVMSRDNNSLTAGTEQDELQLVVSCHHSKSSPRAKPTITPSSSTNSYGFRSRYRDKDAVYVPSARARNAEAGSVRYRRYFGRGKFVLVKWLKRVLRMSGPVLLVFVILVGTSPDNTQPAARQDVPACPTVMLKPSVSAGKEPVVTTATNVTKVTEITKVTKVDDQHAHPLQPSLPPISSVAPAGTCESAFVNASTDSPGQRDGVVSVTTSALSTVPRIGNTKRKFSMTGKCVSPNKLKDIGIHPFSNSSWLPTDVDVSDMHNFVGSLGIV
ncbi:uncharacterized protein LOC135811546 [Sycon ciliatum]|uniref:uncharacterized protein LOC135811546 n=1 Tax=Sycon ciliatum TaxID=27933 RepID=UPI0020ABA97A|eukprot:scpid63633/ scgid34651/ 